MNNSKKRSSWILQNKHLYFRQNFLFSWENKVILKLTQIYIMFYVYHFRDQLESKSEFDQTFTTWSNQIQKQFICANEWTLWIWTRSDQQEPYDVPYILPQLSRSLVSGEVPSISIYYLKTKYINKKN
jgi:hypothetical protein